MRSYAIAAASLVIAKGLAAQVALPAAELARLTPATRSRAEEVAPKTIEELLALPADQLARVDIGLMNLLCAQGLPHSEKVDVAALLATLDKWAERVRYNTNRHLYRLRDSRYAAHYRHSETYFRCEWLLQTLQQDCGVKYNHARIFSPDFSDSRDQFIHGVMDPRQGGTCASMPVLYVAVGRRLGYPLKVVLARGHVFCRWDDGKGDTLNIEGSGEGFSSFPDDLYRAWPSPITEEIASSREYLVSLTPSEELAVFMAARGHCFIDQHRYQEAVDAYEQTVRLAPTFKVHGAFLHAARVGVERGREGYERLVGKTPDRIDWPPIPEKFRQLVEQERSR